MKGHLPNKNKIKWTIKKLYKMLMNKIYKMVEIIEALIHKIMTSKNLEEIKRLTINYR